jgi:hypothetical protein
MSNDAAVPLPEPEGIRLRLVTLRDALLRLHKSLLDSERVEYERTMGPISSPNEFLRLLSTDPWFAWLAPLTHLLVAMDEAVDAREPLSTSTVEAMVSQTFGLLVANETGDGFSKEYFDALQRDPDVVMAHAGVAKLRNKPQAQS